MSVEKLFTDYADAINCGKQVNKEEFITRCPAEGQKELRGLIEMLEIFQRSVIPVKTNAADVDTMFSHLEQRRLARKQESQLKSVSNFSADKELSGEKKQKVDAKIDKLWEEEFGED